MLRTEKRSQRRIVTQITLKSDNPTLSISRGGIAVLSAYPLPDGLLVSLIFNLPGEIEPVTCKARVCWNQASRLDSQLYDIGLHFIEISDQNRQRVEDFIESEIKQFCH